MADFCLMADKIITICLLSPLSLPSNGCTPADLVVDAEKHAQAAGDAVSASESTERSILQAAREATSAWAEKHK